MTEEDLRDVMEEEKSRGRRRPTEAAARRERARLLRGFRELLALDDERAFCAAIRELGLKDGSPEFREALRIWREHARTP